MGFLKHVVTSAVVMAAASTAYAEGWSVGSSSGSSYSAWSVGSSSASTYSTWSASSSSSDELASTWAAESGDIGEGGGVHPTKLAQTDGDWGASAMMVEAPAPDALVGGAGDATPMITNGANAEPMVAVGIDAVPL